MTSCGLQKAIDRVHELQETGDDEPNPTQDGVSDEEALAYLNNKDAEEVISVEGADVGDGSFTPWDSEDFTQFPSAITNFTSAYTSIKDPYSDLINQSPDYDTYLFELLDFSMVDLDIVTAPLYDALDFNATGATKITGTLMLNGYEGTKEKDGDLIRFGYEHTVAEDLGLNVVGDVLKETGYFDTTNNFLTIEDTTFSGGSLVQRSVYELSLLSDGTFILQCHSYDNRSSAEGVTSTFLSVNKDQLTSYTATSAPNVDFTFQSLEGSSNISLDALSEGFITTFVIRVENGTVTLEKK